MKKHLLIIATMDTKGKEAEFVKGCAIEQGVDPLLMDIGTLTEPLIRPDITNYEVARAGGYDLKAIRDKRDRLLAVKAMEEGGADIADRLFNEKKIDGVLGMGGGTGTAIASFIMRRLPFGFPKLVLSTVASRDIREYIRTKDIVMFHSVADLLGFNDFIRKILRQAAWAICGMIREGNEIRYSKPMIAVTAYGVSSTCAINAEPILEKKGYEMIGFHANGIGGMAMEEMIAQGLIAGVLDFTPHEIADDMLGGYCKGIGPERFETAGKMGIPLVFAPGGLDNAVFSPFYPMPDNLKGRRIHIHDIRFCVRMESDEMISFAYIIGERLNRYHSPVWILIPLRGWSEADREGMELYDPIVDKIFVNELRKILRDDIPIEEIDCHISDPAFAERAVDILDSMIRNSVTIT
ncbi:MAG: Tm-1-like ATP-binding domain-containing protein [Syntrophorhabdaceae bacterium]|nr:Tm-1-like ATP-binding domain-containing protein [Syntrophorhabdales bacterium]MBP9560366.1 Tm-1-like ATP-binding domain-containing protein [Syntrophorhabdaceae bacterium]